MKTSVAPLGPLAFFSLRTFGGGKKAKQGAGRAFP
jgi:hypothetical protein